jgi:hypothetical protein
MFGRVCFHRRTEIGAGCKKACASVALETQPSENVPKESHPKVTAPPTRTAAPLGRLGWVLASVSVLVGFGVIAVATRIDREEADHRRANPFIPQQTRMVRSPSDPIPRHSPMAIVDDAMGSQRNHNAASTPEQSALSEEKATLDGKEVRKALPVEVQKTTPIKPADLKRAD